MIEWMKEERKESNKNTKWMYTITKVVNDYKYQRIQIYIMSK